jgi:Small-conductance mechanosensitive channel
VAYGSDVNKVREALIAAAREHPATLNDPEPTAFLEKFGLAPSISRSLPGAVK